MPRVSIITPLHDKGPFIGDTIRSVLAQTMEDWEMIIVENGSSDDGPAKVCSFNDTRIRLIVSDKTGPGAARNLGISHASGEWVLFLDADDLLEGKHLSNLLSLTKLSPDAGILAGGWKTFCNTSSSSPKTHHSPNKKLDRSAFISGAFALTPWVLHAALVKRSLLIGYCMWPEELDAYPDEDTAFWFPLLISSNVAWSAESGALYRVGISDSRSASDNYAQRLKGYDHIIERNLNIAAKMHATLDPKHRWYVALMYEVSYNRATKAGDHFVASAALARAEQWLSVAPITIIPVIIRRLLGIRNVCIIRKALGRIS
jgi:glycosyltransferase involved in cell wall biosynthesis